jgi:hypothetical protein
MGVIPLQRPRPSNTAAACRLCAETKAAETTAASVTRRVLQALPLTIAVAGGVVLAANEIGFLSAIGAGVAAGIVSSTLYAYGRHRSLVRTAHDAHASELRAMAEDADGRVQAVINQFEWAVNDVARLRTQLEAAEADVRTLTDRGREREHQNEQLVRQISHLRERLAEIAMAASVGGVAKTPRRRQFDAVYLSWGLHLDGAHAWLEVQTLPRGERPARIRVADGDGQIVAASGVAIAGPEGQLEFQLEPPGDLIGDLEAGRRTAYTFEALVDEEWRPVHLQDSGRRNRSVVDVQGHLTRANVSHLAKPLDGTRSPLN